MSVNFRSGRWYIDFFPGGRWGKRVRIPLPDGTSEEEARELDLSTRTYHREARSGKPQPRKSGQTVNVLFPKYLEWYEVHRAALSHAGLETVWNAHLKPVFGKEVAENLAAEHLLIYKKIRLRSVKPPTINKELSHLSGFLSWAAREGYITPRQFRIEKIPYKNSLPAVLSPEEVRAVLEVCTPFYRAFLLCLYTLGLRLNEARTLQWKDIDMEGGKVRVRQKGGTWKILPLPLITARQISTIIPKPGCPYVFASRYKEGHISKIDHVLKAACRDAGIKKRVTAHLFRHSVATHLMGAGINLRVIQGFLGHSQIKTTEIYTHVAITNLTDASRIIEGLSTEKPLLP